jgi:hypothetical protein
MKKVLIEKGKHGDYAYDISTQEQSDKVYLTLFKERKKEGWYMDVKSNYFFDKDRFEHCQDGKAVRKFILQRSEQGYEYEEVEELFIQEII